jgi:predicted HTH domain antitoxin
MTKEQTACRLYEKGAVSIGRAAEWAGLSIENFKEILHHRGITRPSSDLEETEALARRSLEASQRSFKKSAP